MAFEAFLQTLLRSSTPNVSDHPGDFFVAKHRSPYILVLPMQIMVKRVGLLRQDSMSKLRDIELDLGFGN